MLNQLERVATVVLTVAAVTIAWKLVRADVGPAQSTPRGPAQELEQIDNWNELVSAGIRVGSDKSPVTVVEFADFECPFCARFHSNFQTVQRQFGAKVSMLFVHFPLPSHRFARPTARAAECAATQGRFEGFADLLFRKQDSLGLKSWVSFAAEAGISDTARFAACARDTVAIARIDRGLALGRKIGVRGTPTIIVNGWRFATPPTDSQLVKTISSLLSGRKPS